jgi:RimJ/RimL family protein N-acetyltransferase
MPAQLYSEQLRVENIKTWYNLEYMFWNGGTGDCEINLPDNNYDSHCFVSVNEHDEVVGYISYNINWTALSADRFGAISFKRGNVGFAKDLYQAIKDIFDKYNLNRIQWCCYADNPAIRGYRNFIKEHGGVECGYYREVARLIDGKLHDSVQFEILAREFKRDKR